MSIMKSSYFRIDPRSWMIAGFILTIPSLVFWCLVIYSRLFHDPRYVDSLLTYGGFLCDIWLKGAFPLASLLIAFICHKTLRQEAISSNTWHRETPMMRINRGLINWNAWLLLLMIISLINN